MGFPDECLSFGLSFETIETILGGSMSRLQMILISVVSIFGIMVFQNCGDAGNIRTAQQIGDSIGGPLSDDGETGPGAPDLGTCLLYTSPSPRDATISRMPSSA